jgi:hypothetical protein
MAPTIELGLDTFGDATVDAEGKPLSQAYGALFVGSPQTVAAKILSSVKTLGLSRFDLKYANGTMPHDKLMTSIELYGTQVVPLVRDALG